MSTLTVDRNYILKAYGDNPSARQTLIGLFRSLFPTISPDLNAKIEFGVVGKEETKDFFIAIANKLGCVYNEDFQSKNEYYCVYFSYYWMDELYGPSYSYSCTNKPINLDENFEEALRSLLKFIKP